jgi:hypothetical protein
MAFRDNVITAITPHIEDDAARAVVADLLEFVRTTEKVLQGDSSDETRLGMARSFVALTTGLNSNPFWLRHSGYIMPVFATTASAWMDSIGYVQGSTSSDRAAFLVTRNMLPEVAVAVLYCESGAKGVQDHALILRKKLLELGGT